jgi:hypothetical protein
LLFAHWPVKASVLQRLVPAGLRIEEFGECNELTAAHGFELAGAPALLHFSKRLDVVVWPPALLDQNVTDP